VKNLLEVVEDFCSVAKGFREGRSALGHDHEFLEIDRGVRVGAAVDYVHHRDGQDLGVRSPDVAEEGQTESFGGGFGRGQGDPEDGIGTQVAFVLGAVELPHNAVDYHLIGGVFPDDGIRNLFVDRFHSLGYAFSEVVRLVSIAQFNGFVFAGAGTAGDGGATAGTTFEVDIVPPRSGCHESRKLAADDVNDGGVRHEIARMLEELVSRRIDHRALWVNR